MTLIQCHGCNLYSKDIDTCSVKYDEMKTCIDGSQYRPIDNKQKSFKACHECGFIHGKYPSLSTVLDLLNFHAAVCRVAAHNWIRWALRNTAKRCENCKLDPELKYPFGVCNPFADCYGPMREGLCITCNEIKILNTDGVCKRCWNEDVYPGTD